MRGGYSQQSVAHFSHPLDGFFYGVEMLKKITAAKLKAFQGYASCAWTQQEAEKIWGETFWKLGLKPKELLSISEGWANFVISGDASQLNEACTRVITRMGA